MFNILFAVWAQNFEIVNQEQNMWNYIIRFIGGWLGIEVVNNIRCVYEVLPTCKFNF